MILFDQFPDQYQSNIHQTTISNLFWLKIALFKIQIPAINKTPIEQLKTKMKQKNIAKTKKRRYGLKKLERIK